MWLSTCSLAGVSRSVTLVVAYIMTVTDFGWEDALHTVRAGRSCANPNLGFQRQLQEFEELQVHQVTARHLHPQAGWLTGSLQPLAAVHLPQAPGELLPLCLGVKCCHLDEAGFHILRPKPGRSHCVARRPLAGVRADWVRAPGGQGEGAGV